MGIVAPEHLRCALDHVLVPCSACEGTGHLFDDARLGAVLQRERQGHGLTQQRVAKALGFSAAYLRDLEYGRRKWSHNLASRYLAALAAPGGFEVRTEQEIRARLAVVRHDIDQLRADMAETGDDFNVSDLRALTVWRDLVRELKWVLGEEEQT